MRVATNPHQPSRSPRTRSWGGWDDIKDPNRLLEARYCLPGPDGGCGDGCDGGDGDGGVGGGGECAATARWYRVSPGLWRFLIRRPEGRFVAPDEGGAGGSCRALVSLPCPTRTDGVRSQCRRRSKFARSQGGRKSWIMMAQILTHGGGAIYALLPSASFCPLRLPTAFGPTSPPPPPSSPCRIQP